jgi:hypothetical protein
VSFPHRRFGSCANTFKNILFDARALKCEIPAHRRKSTLFIDAD